MKNKRKGVYSTNPNFKYDDNDDEIQTPIAEKQSLTVHIDRRRSGKTAVIIKNFIGNTTDLKHLGRTVKEKCGVGGGVKNGEIIIQGNIREKVIYILEDKGYKCKKVGG